MKANKIFLAAGAFMMTLASCTDLKVPIESQYTEYPDTELALEAKMSDVYFQMRGPMGRRIFELLGCASDEFTAVSYGGDYYDGGFAVNPSYHASTKSDATVDWSGELTSGITKANKVIVELGGEKASPKAIAPARFMRAYFTYWYMNLWGAAPIIDHPLADGENADRQPRSKVAAWIESELVAIKDDLTEDVTPNTYGKPTKWACLGLLARLYTNWPVFACDDVTTYNAGTANPKANDVVKVCNEIIKSKLFGLGSMEWRFKFNHDNGPKVEDFIYVMPYDSWTQAGNQHGRAFTWKDLKSCDPTYYGAAFGNSFGGYMTLTPEYVSIFNLPGDVRNNAILGLTTEGKVYTYDKSTLLATADQTMYKGEPIVLSKTIDVSADYMQLNVGKNTNGYCQGLRPVKFFLNADQYNNGRNASNDMPLIRYADILLMKAEAIVRGATDEMGQSAKSLFNQVRTYAKAPELPADPTLDEIYQERGREFLGEGLRRDDMIRFGHYEDEFFPHYKTGEYAKYAKFDKTMRIFPIHQDRLNENPTWQQNPGY